MARKDEAVRGLADLGLTPAEAEAYCQLVRSTADGPVSRIVASMPNASSRPVAATIARPFCAGARTSRSPIT